MLSRMRSMLASAALAASALASSQEPIGVSYQWSASGRQYALGVLPFERVGNGLGLGVAFGTEVSQTKATVFGPVVTYDFLRQSQASGAVFTVGASAGVLFGAQSPDVALGVTFGLRF